MLDSVVLDVVIGLVFIYLLYSLLATIVGEMIATWMGIRARVLRKAVEQMLNDHTEVPAGSSKTERALHSLQTFFLVEKDEFRRSLAGRFYRQPSMKYMASGTKSKHLSFRNGKPSYITAGNFSDTILHMLRGKGQGADDMAKMRHCLELNSLHIQAETLAYLKHLYEDAGGDAQQFKKNLEKWFNDTMDRCTGWYKRKLQVILFAVGFALAAFFNADTLRMVSILSKDKNARDQLVQLGIQAGDSTSSLSRALKRSGDTRTSDSLLRNSYFELNEAVNGTNSVMGLGYNEDDKLQAKIFGRSFKWYKQLNPVHKEFWGIVITALAISLGAPFWFDLLKRLVSIRGAGVNPNEKKDGAESEALSPAAETAGTMAMQTKFMVPAPESSPPVDAARNLLADVEGLLLVRDGFVRKDNAKQRAIEVYLNSDDAMAKAKQKAGDIFQDMPVHYILNTPALPHLAGGDVIYNNSQVNGRGTLACYCSRIDSNKVYLLSCWHVLKGDHNWNEVSGPLNIDTTGKPGIAHIVDGCIAESFDVGFAEMTNPTGLSNTSLNLKFNWREVNSNDAFSETAVTFKGSNSGPQQAVIYNNNVAQPIDYPDGQRTLSNLFCITSYDANGGFLSPSQAGDSGALVVDSKGYPLGIVVGGDSAFTYVARFSAFMGSDSFYNEYKIII